MPGLLLGGIRSKAILQLKTGQAVSEQVDQPQRHQGHETSGNEQSQRDGRQSVAQADVQKGRNQSPGPGSGPRQGDATNSISPSRRYFRTRRPFRWARRSKASIFGAKKACFRSRSKT